MASKSDIKLNEIRESLFTHAEKQQERYERYVDYYGITHEKTVSVFRILEIYVNLLKEYNFI